MQGEGGTPLLRDQQLRTVDPTNALRGTAGRKRKARRGGMRDDGRPRRGLRRRKGATRLSSAYQADTPACAARGPDVMPPEYSETGAGRSGCTDCFPGAVRPSAAGADGGRFTMEGMHKNRARKPARLICHISVPGHLPCFSL